MEYQGLLGGTRICVA